MKKLFYLFLAFVLLCGCTSGPEEQSVVPADQENTTAPVTQKQTTVPPEGEPAQTRPAAPDITVYDREGDPVKLSDFIGKPVVLNFWASWCGPCKNEMPHFQQAYETYGEEIHFVIVDLTDGVAETPETAYAYVDGCGYTFPVYCDTTGEAANTYGIYSIPTTFFLHADGTVEGYIPGSMDLETLEMAISLIKKGDASGKK